MHAYASDAMKDVGEVADDAVGGTREDFQHLRFANQRTRRASRTRRARRTPTSTVSLLISIAVSGVPAAMAQNCISLAGSAACVAFNQSTISTGSQVADRFPFLAFVSDVQSFDEQLERYIATDYAQLKYQQLIGCNDINLRNTDNIYARYTTSALCNAIVQNSIDACGASQGSARPLCAETCAQMATSEHDIAASPELCGKSGPDAVDQIRADFTNCALPANSLSGSCIEGWENEPADCGFSSNLPGLCSFCAASSPNSTDYCCVNAEAETRCEGVHLPITTSMPPLFPSSTASSSPSATSTEPSAPASSSNSGALTAGQIAGIVLGAVVGAIVLLGLLIFVCVFLRRRRTPSNQGSVFNRPSPSRQGPSRPGMTYTDGPQLDVTPVGRIARMSALEGTSSSSGRGTTDRRSYPDSYSTPRSRTSGLGLGPGAVPPKRGGSLADDSPRTVGDDHTSPQASSGDGTYTTGSPNGVTSGQSEQLQFFKDYYSQDEIRPNDVVATLWAYQPRANDEWELERGDMLRVVGIWDDGWATGVRLTEHAEEWEARRNWQRDSGVSNASQTPPSGVAHGGEIKAFPLVCVCLPQHWRKTIEGDTTDLGTSSSGGPPPPPPASP